MKFFVAKVDVEKVKFQAGPDGVERVMLSPLRFHYDSPEFSLPVRLGCSRQGAVGARRRARANAPRVPG